MRACFDSAPEKPFIDFEIGALGLSNGEVDDIVAFLRALADPRVISRQAPFDHPQWFVPNGAVTNSAGGVVRDPDGTAKDLLIEVPAVGRGGGAALPGFLSGG